jgi:hypothetical protein
VNDEPIALVAVFPCFYPYTRCEIIAPDFKLSWHQNPYNKNLCLIGRSTTNWDTDNLLATFLATQLPKLLAAARTQERDEAQDKEENQAEPFTAFLPYLRGSVVLVLDDLDLPLDIQHGKLDFRVSAGAMEFRACYLRFMARAKITYRELKTFLTWRPFPNSMKAIGTDLYFRLQE